MSLLNYGFTPISKTATTSGTSELPEGADLDELSDADCSDIDSMVPEAESDSEAQSAITGGVSSGSSSFPEISDSKDDPSIPFPQDSCLRALCIHQEPHQPSISKYKVTIEPKLEAFVQSGMSFTVGKVDRMFFVCRAFAHKVIGSVGRVDLSCDIWIPKIFGPPKYLDPPVQILLKYADLLKY